MSAKTTLFVLLGLVGAIFLAVWAAALRETRRSARSSGARDRTETSDRAERVAPTLYETFVGAITNFFDTLGIGSYATTTTLYRARKTIDDRLLPGTLTIGHTIPTFAEAYIFIDQVAVDPTTLVSMIAAATAGAVLGAPVVASFSRRKVQIGMGLALLAVCGILVWRQIGLPEDGAKIGLSGAALAVAVVASFVLGALMTIGVGLYAPALVVVSLLGMNPKAGFPIMMGSCAFLQALASIPFIRKKAYAPGAAVGLSLGGLPAVLVAAFIVKSLPLYWVKWLVAVVVVYTAAMMLRAARRGESRGAGDGRENPA
ncbi:MAG TPA: sulfite exporter TauE/SafE family protein [Polyangiaceae bacterium]|nr:sulfite exporter TauE/SafE family protein [Polyangiaceae bacterium]